MYGVYTVFLAGILSNIRSYTVYIYGSGQPYKKGTSLFMTCCHTCSHVRCGCTALADPACTTKCVVQFHCSRYPYTPPCVYIYIYTRNDFSVAIHNGASMRSWPTSLPLTTPFLSFHTLLASIRLYFIPCLFLCTVATVGQNRIYSP
jgi:hypothetical protein